MRGAALSAWIALAGSGIAQDAGTLSGKDLARVEIDGLLNLRDAPNVESDSIIQFENGRILRLMTCQEGPEQDWCEVETAGGENEGWVSARFLRPHLGADPAALETLSFPADATDTIVGARQVRGRLGQGEIVDYQLILPPDRLLALDLDAPLGIRMGVLSADGHSLAQGDDLVNANVVLPKGGEVTVRLVDMAGDGGDWTLDVRID